jgi:predicted RecA/RadA family phage recombinase
MKNYVQDGEVITVTAPYTVASGAGCLVGSLFGVATSAASSGASVEIKTTGVFDLTTLGTDTPAQGAIAYWDDTNKRLTTTASGNTDVGRFTVAKTNGPTVGRVRLRV